MRLGTSCKQCPAILGTPANLCTSPWPCIISVVRQTSPFWYVAGVNSYQITGKASGLGTSWRISGVNTKSFSIGLLEGGLCGYYEKPVHEVNVRSTSDRI